MNQVNLIGNLTKETEVKYAASGSAVLKNGIAVRRDKERTDFINIVAFGKTAELIANYFQKGNQIGISGSIVTGQYENSEGKKVYTTDVMVNSITFINGNKDKKEDNPRMRNEPPKTSDDPFSGGQTIDISSDDLPF